MASLARRLLPRLAEARRAIAPPAPAPAFRRLSTAATDGVPPPLPTPPPVAAEEPQPRSQEPPPPPPPPPGWSPSSSSSRPEEESAQRRSSAAAAGGKYEEEHERVLRAALVHVPKLGWGESAMIAGARDVGVSPSIIGAFPRKDAALVEFFMDDSLQRLIDHIEAGGGEQLKNFIVSERLSRLIRIRLEMQSPYIAKWPEALSIQSQPLNLPTSLKQRALLVDEFWHAAGESGSDIDWYVKRTALGAIYSTAEVYMVTDNSPEFSDTWNFVDRRVKDFLDLRKTFREAAYLAEAVGAGMGGTVQGLMKGIFKG